VRDFAEAFATVGLPSYTPNAAYGLAEHTVACGAFSPNHGGGNLSHIPDERLQASVDVQFSNGQGGVIKIVDPETYREVPVGDTGEMWISSDSVAAGYWGKPELTQGTFRARIKRDITDETSAPPWADLEFLRTGDLCRVDAEGLLYVEGRLKDLVIVAGRNIYPQDLEFIAQDASSLVRPGCIAVFSETELGGGLEIVMEVRDVSKKNPEAVREALEAVRRSVISECGLTPSRMVAIKERTIPKTTSGKIQRRKTRTMLHAGDLDVVQELRLDPTETVPTADPDISVRSDREASSTATPVVTSAKRAPHLAPTFKASPHTTDDNSTMATGVEGIEESDDLLELGVDSLLAVGISKDLSEACGCELPQELVFTHPTATLIAEFISSAVLNRHATPRARVSPERPGRGVDHGSHARMVIPPDPESSKVQALGLLGVLSPIIWFTCFTAIIVVTKLLLGAHPEERVPLGTRAYLSWWYMNTMLNVWECVGGAWLLDTKLMIFIYRRMGAKIAWTASISVFIRDFDSVDVQAGANVGGNLYVRRFEASYMDVKPIMIGKGADIRTGSVVYGGASVGDHCVVEPLTVIPPLSKLAPHSTWEGHPAKETKKGGPANGGESLDVPGPCLAIPCLIELVKLFSILCTMVAMTTMTYIPTILYESTGLSGNFRYAVLVKIIFLVAGVPSQLALYTVLLKWALAGRVTEGSYQPTVFQTWRRWYLGRLNTLVFAYLHPFNMCPRYEWWAAALGVKVGRGSVVLLQGYNPEDAHLVEIGPGAHVGTPTLSVDRPTG
ncbi:unnamed protein product, partial [Ectocarpus sp. 13 AM-2016]